MKLLNDIEDPYSYRERFTMPKYVVEAAGDQYFCPDRRSFITPSCRKKSCSATSRTPTMA